MPDVCKVCGQPAYGTFVIQRKPEIRVKLCWRHCEDLQIKESAKSTLPRKRKTRYAGF